MTVTQMTIEIMDELRVLRSDEMDRICWRDPRQHSAVAANLCKPGIRALTV